MSHKTSIRRRLLSLVLSLVTLLWLLAMSLVFIQTHHEISEVFDAHLVQDARVLINLPWQARAHSPILEMSSPTEWLEDTGEDEKYHEYEKSITFLVRTRTGELIARTDQSPILPVYPHFSLRNYADKEMQWRVFTLMEKGLIVQTAEPFKMREHITYESLSHALYAALLTLPVLALVIVGAVTYSFRPLQQLVSELGQRHAESLQPLTGQTIPQEIQPLITALNHLFQRVEHTLNNERRFTADASHELRTPLAGLKTQAQVALNARTSEQQQQALQLMLKGIDSSTRLVEQLLILARFDAHMTLPKQEVHLEHLLQDLISEAWSRASTKNIDLGMSNTWETDCIWAHPDSLRVMLRNFIDNAIHYTPAGGQVTVYMRHCGGDACVCVDDNGVGIPADVREAMFERFYRGQHQHLSGSGLGLSIAQRIAELHDWSLRLDTGLSGQGLAVWLNLTEKAVR